MPQNQTIDHDHTHTELETALAKQVRSMMNHAEFLEISNHLLRKALLQLLPNDGDSVVLELNTEHKREQITFESDELVQSVRVFRNGEVLDIAKNGD